MINNNKVKVSIYSKEMDTRMPGVKAWGSLCLHIQTLTFYKVRAEKGENQDQNCGYTSNVAKHPAKVYILFQDQSSGWGKWDPDTWIL